MLDRLPPPPRPAGEVSGARRRRSAFLRSPTGIRRTRRPCREKRAAPTRSRHAAASRRSTHRRRRDADPIRMSEGAVSDRPRCRYRARSPRPTQGAVRRRARAGPAAAVSTLPAVGWPTATRASASPLRGAPARLRIHDATQTNERHTFPTNSSTRAVKALGSKSVAGLPVSACERPIPPPRRLSRHRRRTLIAARSIKSPISPPLSPLWSGRLADDTPPPHAQRTTAPSGARRRRFPPRGHHRCLRAPPCGTRVVGPEKRRLPSPASPSPKRGLAVGFVLPRVEAAVEGER